MDITIQLSDVFPVKKQHSLQLIGLIYPVPGHFLTKSCKLGKIMKCFFFFAISSNCQSFKFAFFHENLSTGPQGCGGWGLSKNNRKSLGSFNSKFQPSYIFNFKIFKFSIFHENFARIRVVVGGRVGEGSKYCSRDVGLIWIRISWNTYKPN